MRTKSFELEETVPGIFLLQGWLGGVLAAFGYVVAFCLFERDLWLSDALMVTLYLSVLTGILGVMKSVIMWAPYRLTKFQPHAVPIDDLRETLLKAYRERNHECLGSRFMAWHT